MTQVVATVPADQVLSLTSSVWRLSQQQDSGSLVGSAEIDRIIAGWPDAGHAAHLREFIRRIDALEPDVRREFTAAMDEVQIRSKLWLLGELAARRSLSGATLVVLGAWFGILPLLANWRLARPPARMTCIDISARACALGQEVVGPLYPNIDYRVADAMDLDYPSIVQQPSSVLVNTICEHLPDPLSWWARVAPGQFTVLQSNNYEACSDHVNCVQSLEQMKAQTPLSDVLFEGALPLGIMNRFMLIGVR